MDFNEPRWTPVDGSPYQVSARSDGGKWTRVRDGDDGRPLDVRIQLMDGRPRVLGLRLDDGLPVTARQLRAVSLPEIEAAFGLYMARKNADLELLEENTAHGGALSSEDAEEAWGNSLIVQELRQLQGTWAQDLQGSAETELGPRGLGASPPTDNELRRFAAALQSQRLTRHRGAVTRTAKTLGMHRTTAHRWIKTCEERGFLPSDKKGSS